ncbi:MAG TPA: choice-of-anchor tandem repeat GloVer-containing protein [Rhizomicrobium sp.]|nr:choice-of-anchor tandem repeat GloVer-containing protein [Rhizomicrobium sp.]
MSNRSLLASVFALSLSIGYAEAKSFVVLHAFQGSDGANPYSTLIRDGAGNLYGTTDGGGANGLGTVFQLAPDGTETVLHAFGGASDGILPVAGLITDKAGNFYGTTQDATDAYGAVFKLAPDGTETVLHYFPGGTDGAMPVAPLAIDKAGNLYGTTQSGGGDGCHGTGCGIAFEITPDGTETVLYSFTGKKGDGATPVAGLIAKEKYLYGTTLYGGADLYGTVFRLAEDGSEKVLHSFAGGPGDGANPEAGVTMDAAGNLYGTSYDGGAYQFGAVFRLASDGTISLIHSFAGGTDGAYPMAGLLLDASGNLYGTTNNGGSNACQGSGCGTVFKIAPDGTETVLHAFGHKSEGRNPEASLIGDRRGNLYGTTPYGGTDNFGTIFKVKE